MYPFKKQWKKNKKKHVPMNLNQSKKNSRLYIYIYSRLYIYSSVFIDNLRTYWLYPGKT
jgi:hypothetical protein